MGRGILIAIIFVFFNVGLFAQLPTLPLLPVAYTPADDIDTSYHPRYQMVITKANNEGWTIPTAPTRKKQDTLMTNAVNSGWIDSLDFLFVHAQDGSEEFGRINWCDTSNFNCTEPVAVTWTSNEGARNAGTGYYDTNYDPSSDAVNFSTNDASILVFTYDEPASSSSNALAAISGGGSVIRWRGENPSGNCQAAITGNLNTGTSNSWGNAGLTILNRIASTEMKVYFDGVEEATITQASGSTPTVNLFLLAANNSGTPLIQDGGETFSILGFGGSVADVQGTINTHIVQYMESIGW